MNVSGLRTLEIPTFGSFDAEIQILAAICDIAATSTDSPFQALFKAYEKEFYSRGLDTNRDNAVFRWLTRVGENSRRTYRIGRPTDFIPYMRSILEAHGITVLDDETPGITIIDEDGYEAEEEIRVFNNKEAGKQQQLPRRRVSFDDAQLEETWLSERSQFDLPMRTNVPGSLLRQRPRRVGDYSGSQRGRSTSSHDHLPSRRPAPGASQIDSLLSEYGSQDERSLVFLNRPSEAELEMTAEGFQATSELRMLRRVFRTWLDETETLRRKRSLAVEYENSRRESIAKAYDRRLLLKQSFDAWSGACAARRLEREHETRERQRVEALAQLLAGHVARRDRNFLVKAFDHWFMSVRYERKSVEKAHKILLMVRYFSRWRKIALDNAERARSLLLRKFLVLWRDKTARRLLVHEQAIAHFEERLMRKCYLDWYWKNMGRKVQDSHDLFVARNMFNQLCTQMRQRKEQEYQAEDAHETYLATSIVGVLKQQTGRLREATASAELHRRTALLSKCFRAIRIAAKFCPNSNTLTLKVDSHLKLTAFRVWHLHFSLSRQAAEVDRKRVLQIAWTSWNDTLRSKALGQRIDERVLLETLYKWVLHTRLRSFQRAQDAKSSRRALLRWSSKLRNTKLALAHSQADFEASKRWRTLKFGMLRFNMAMRNHEDAERAATEFSNSRTLPDVLDVWKVRTGHARQLAKWAVDARFYCLTTRTIKLWREKTEEHQRTRRKEAYTRIRAKLKIKLARDCLARLHTKAAEVASMRQEAERLARKRVIKVGMDAFDTLRQKTVEFVELDLRAQATDHQKLLASAFTALTNHQAELTDMEQDAIRFRQETDIGILRLALRKIQWSTFQATQRAGTADALAARNRDLHIKHMLRHWASQTAARLAVRSAPPEPESPSLRPASRARSAERSATRALTSSPRSATPAYMHTPSRSRRAGSRFRPLPTPAHATPMAFDKAYLFTTPAPVTEVGEISDLFYGQTPPQQITPFARKLRAGGVLPSQQPRHPPSVLRTSVFGKSAAAGGTGKSVRFAGGSRFGGSVGREGQELVLEAFQ